MPAKRPTLSATTVSAAPEEAFDFEQALAGLEDLVERLEQGDLPLEASLTEFLRRDEILARLAIHLSPARTLGAEFSEDEFHAG